MSTKELAGPHWGLTYGIKTGAMITPLQKEPRAGKRKSYKAAQRSGEGREEREKGGKREAETTAGQRDRESQHQLYLSERQHARCNICVT